MMLNWKEIFGPRALQVSVWRVTTTQLATALGSMVQALDVRLRAEGDAWESLEPWDRASEFLEGWRWGVLPDAQGALVTELTADAGGPLLMLRMRQHKSPDGRLLKARVKEAMATALADWSGPRNKKGRAKVSKMDRALIAEDAGRQLVREAAARVTAHAVVWCPEDRLLLVFGGGPKVRAGVAQKMREVLQHVLASTVYLDPVGLDAATRRWQQVGAWTEFGMSWLKWLQAQAGPLSDGRCLEARQGDQRVRLHALDGFTAKGPGGAKLVVEGEDLVRAQIGNEAVRVQALGLLVDVRDELAHKPESMRFGLVLDKTGWPVQVRAPKTSLEGLGMALERMRQVVLLVAGVEVLLAAWWLAVGKTVAAQGAVLLDGPEPVKVGEPGAGW